MLARCINEDKVFSSGLAVQYFVFVFVFFVFALLVYYTSIFMAAKTIYDRDPGYVNCPKLLLLEVESFLKISI